MEINNIAHCLFYFLIMWVYVCEFCFSLICVYGGCLVVIINIQEIYTIVYAMVSLHRL